MKTNPPRRIETIPPPRDVLPHGTKDDSHDSPHTSEERPVQPFLRWAGGKRQLAQFLSKMIPRETLRGSYWEPFAGAAGLFFHLLPKRAYLADANIHLMNCYGFVRDTTAIVSRKLALHASRDCADYYYVVRNQYNRSRNQATPEQAARFIYLNRTCFNGIFRVNQAGDFNVPYGHKRPALFPNNDTLTQAAAVLKSAVLRSADFRDVLTGAVRGDFVYLDPPYPALDETAFFSHYTATRFSKRDHYELAEIVTSLSDLGCNVLISNADTTFIRNLYRRFELLTFSRCRFVSCKSHKRRVNELALKNF